MPATPQLDVRTIPPPERHPKIFSAFDALKPGAAFILVNDHYPRPLLFQFQNQRPGRFDWNVLQFGPDLYRVEIRRREAEGPRTVSEYLESDHERIDAFVPAVNESLAAGALEDARQLLAQLWCGLDRHLDVEEEILFPVFEEKTNMMAHGRGPTVLMREEHVEIRRHLDEAAAALKAENVAAVNEALDELTALLASHNIKEERIIYPLTDQALKEEASRDALVRQMQLF